MSPSSAPAARLTRVSGVLALLGVAVEAAAAFLSVTPIGARVAPVAWAPFVVAAVALAVAGTSLGRKAPIAAALGLCGAAGIGVGMAGVPLAGAGVAFAAVLFVGEALAVAIFMAGSTSEAVATGASLLSAAVVISLLALFGERLDVVLSTTGVAVGGGLALLQLAAARYADGAVAQRFGADDVVAAAAARLTEVPRRLVLAMLGASGAEGTA